MASSLGASTHSLLKEKENESGHAPQPQENDNEKNLINHNTKNIPTTATSPSTSTTYLSTPNEEAAGKGASSYTRSMSNGSATSGGSGGSNYSNSSSSQPPRQSTSGPSHSPSNPTASFSLPKSTKLKDTLVTGVRAFSMSGNSKELYLLSKDFQTLIELWLDNESALVCRDALKVALASTTAFLQKYAEEKDALAQISKILEEVVEVFKKRVEEGFIGHPDLPLMINEVLIPQLKQLNQSNIKRSDSLVFPKRMTISSTKTSKSSTNVLELSVKTTIPMIAVDRELQSASPNTELPSTPTTPTTPTIIVSEQKTNDSNQDTQSITDQILAKIPKWKRRKGSTLAPHGLGKKYYIYIYIYCYCYCYCYFIFVYFFILLLLLFKAHFPHIVCYIYYI